eukprot:768332-Hanusia_phi.AAC.1
MSFKIRLCNEDVVMPNRQTLGSACYDIYSAEDKIIKKKSREGISTGIQTEFPKNYLLRVLPRSGLSFKYGIESGSGVIDSDYRGEIKVLLYNHSDEDYIVKKGDRIAQMAFMKIELPDLEQVNELSDTDRNNGGFGSTGK